jgi:hypothetical protein
MWFSVGVPFSHVRCNPQIIINVQVGHLPCITTCSRASLDALTGADLVLGFDDIYGKPEHFECLPAMPFNVVDKHLGMM